MQSEGFRIVGDGAVELLQAGVGFAPVEPTPSLIGFEGDGLVEIHEALVDQTLVLQRDAEVDVSLVEVRLHTDGLPVLGEPLVFPARIAKHVAEVEVGGGVFRIEFDGLAVAGQGLFGSARLVKHVAKGVAGRVVVRLEADGFSERGDGVIPQPVVYQCMAQAEGAQKKSGLNPMAVRNSSADSLSAPLPFSANPKSV